MHEGECLCKINGIVMVHGKEQDWVFSDSDGSCIYGFAEWILVAFSPFVPLVLR